jgi:hypothetical protein
MAQTSEGTAEVAIFENQRFIPVELAVRSANLQTPIKRIEHGTTISK